MSESLCTYSSPKRYLWDRKPSKEEWRLLTLPGENSDKTPDLLGITCQLRSDGSLDPDSRGGMTYKYSRASLMTLALLEMLAQARRQVNTHAHRSPDTGAGHISLPRRLRRLILTCPTAMSRLERESLTQCARDAVALLANFNGDSQRDLPLAQVVPPKSSPNDESPQWYYDEATCSQLVYMYGEIGHKFKGRCREFFHLYGHRDPNCDKDCLLVASLDIGAGTSDLMISRYDYQSGDTTHVTTVSPQPLFYDSFYHAGDDMLNALVRNIMLLSPDSALRRALPNLSPTQYRQTIKDFFGPDHNGQSFSDRELRKNFNLQYSVPLMCHFLELNKTQHSDCSVSYADVFSSSPVSPAVIEGFRQRTGIDLITLQWNFSSAQVSEVVTKHFDPLLKKIATIIHAHACDLVILSGRPASLPAIRDIFLKYYPVSPDRLIVLNNYYVGDWYPFSNNTGYITDSKTIVAMGGIVALYAARLSRMGNFLIDLERLNQGLRSTVNYVEASHESKPGTWLIAPDQAQGQLAVSQLPTRLNVAQLGVATYPRRPLYLIDFNRSFLSDSIRRQALIQDKKILTDGSVQSLLQQKLDSLHERLPFRVTLERDAEDMEHLSIASIVDRDDQEIQAEVLEIHIQSLGSDDKYWLDTGIFHF